MFCSSITGHLCPLWAVDGRPHSDVFFTSAPPGQAFCHSSDLMALVSSYSRATSQALFHRFQFAVLTLVRLYFMVTVSSSPRVALLSNAKDTPIEEKQPGQGTRRPDHVRLSACQEGLEGSATAGPPPGHQHPRPFSGGGRTSLDGPAPGQAGLQDPNSGQRGPECTASCSLLNNSAGSPPPGGHGRGSAGVHAGFRLGFHDGYRSLMLIYSILYTNIEPGSPQNQAENLGGGWGCGGICRLAGYVVGVRGGSVCHTDRPDRRGTITTAGVRRDLLLSHYPPG